MKNAMFATLCLAALCSSVPGTLYALPAADPAAPATTPAFPSPDAVVEMLGSKLSLSQDQASAIAPIIADRQQKIKAILADTTAGAMERRRKAREVFSDSDAKINAILTSEQRKKYAEIEQQMREQMRQHMRQ
jgi:Spy/CpxP family protein refolding chaperone